MRLFQNAGVYTAYKPRLRKLRQGLHTFKSYLEAFKQDRYNGSHFLKPVDDGDETAFLTNGDDVAAQKLWASENGLSANASLTEIMLAQIEAHRTEVFYNLDPVSYGNAFLRQLPGCVRKTIAWRAAPSNNAAFFDHDLIVCNFPSILKGYTDEGWKAAYFFPSHDPALDPYAQNTDRPIDVLFVGGYTQYHRRRAALLEAVAALRKTYHIELKLVTSRVVMLADSPIGIIPPLNRYRRPRDLRKTAYDPTFGRDLYSALSKAKIVLNGAIDMAGDDRGNMRCWEAMGSRSLMVSDTGNYPDGMVEGRTMLTYDDVDGAISQIKSALDHPERALEVANAGYAEIRERYSRDAQWKAFQDLAN